MFYLPEDFNIERDNIQFVCGDYWIYYYNATRKWRVDNSGINYFNRNFKPNHYAVSYKKMCLLYPEAMLKLPTRALAFLNNGEK